VSPSRVWALWRKDLALGPRSPILLYAIAMPIVITLLLQGVFGNLFERPPRLAVHDAGDSALTAAALDTDTLRVTRLGSLDELQRRVAAHDFDAGLALGADFDAELRAGRRPPLLFYVAGESLASDRVILAVTTIDLVRGVEGRLGGVEVEVVAPGGEGVPLRERLVPFAVLMALIVAGVFVTSFSFVEEREKRTIDALLASPLTIGEMLWAKGLFGGTLAAAMAAATMALNGGQLARSPGILLALLLGAVMAAQIGLLYGVVSRDTKMLFALFKSLNLVVFGPALFYVFPDWPRWIAYLFPTYWVIDPIVELGQYGAPLVDVLPELAVGAALCALLVPIVLRLARGVRAPAGA
jgi:ABC-2 type transport system permease protein